MEALGPVFGIVDAVGTENEFATGHITAEERVARHGGEVGEVAGGAAAAALTGAAAGFMFGPVGSLLGGIAGGVAGWIGGRAAGETLVAGVQRENS